MANGNVIPILTSAKKLIIQRTFEEEKLRINAFVLKMLILYQIDKILHFRSNFLILQMTTS